MINSYASILRRRLPLIALLTVVLAVLGVLLLAQRPLEYRSQALLEVSSGSLAESVIGQTRGYEEPARRLATEIEVLTSPRVAEAAAALLQDQGLPITPAEAAARLEVELRGASNYLEVSATGETPRAAQQVTSAFVTAYFEYRRALHQEEFRQLEDQLEEQLSAAEAALAPLPADPAPGTPAALERAAALERVQTTTELLEAVRLRSSIESSAVRLASDASLPDSPVGQLALPTALAVSLFCAFFLAVALTLLLELWRDPVRTPEEAEHVAGAPALATVPAAPGRGRPLAFPRDAGVAAARALRLHLQGLAGGTMPRRVMLTSLSKHAHEAHSVGRMLAAAGVLAGERVLLVSDVDGVDHVGTPPTRQTGHIAARGVVATPDGRTGVWRAPLTTKGHDATGVLDAGSLTEVLDEFESRFDLVVVVAPESSQVDAVAVSHFMTAVLLVVTLRVTGGRRLARLAAAFRKATRPVQGLVVVAPDRRLRRPRGQVSDPLHSMLATTGRERGQGTRPSKGGADEGGTSTGGTSLPGAVTAMSGSGSQARRAGR